MIKSSTATVESEPLLPSAQPREIGLPAKNDNIYQTTDEMRQVEQRL